MVAPPQQLSALHSSQHNIIIHRIRLLNYIIENNPPHTWSRSDIYIYYSYLDELEYLCHYIHDYHNTINRQ